MSVRKLSDYDGFKKVLKESKNIVALTGAGVSAESGIPTFRGEGGLWRTYRASNLATPGSFLHESCLGLGILSLPQSCCAHKILAEYEKICEEQDRNLTVITQNVDGLHKRAGSQKVIELHGALHKVKCTKCNVVYDNYDNPICEALRGRGVADSIGSSILNKDLPIIERDDLPKCKDCQGLLRPHIVWFGENLDPKVLLQARESLNTDSNTSNNFNASTFSNRNIFCRLSCSHVCSPWQQRGKPVAEFNLNDAPADDTFEFHFPGKCELHYLKLWDYNFINIYLILMR
ncbi:hypothetical protein NQ318_002529 [Aromia moschata]|uniref:Deacetylase sirtuin-type domain-containing protein n=1 Tax=Aromia moschata TaxID=1265417 RepID=A0AAV8Y9F2_9CUCU|nr:hypothetical protein NQ318_002529 [Aromia moschata]